MCGTPKTVAVCRAEAHRFSKTPQTSISLIEGIGVEGDAHAGQTVQHRSRVKADPAQPNLRQVHLLHSELFHKLANRGLAIGPGDIGENITTSGIDLLGLPRDTLLSIGERAIIKVTGLRNPCQQLDDLIPGLMAAVLETDAAGKLVRKSGVMGTVVRGGMIRLGDRIEIELPDPPHQALVPV